jgi:hypothetical protein
MSQPITAAQAPQAQAAENPTNIMSASLIFTGIRCVLQYAFLPFILPLLGIAGGVAVQISLVINVVAIASLLYSVRRLWAINYKNKWAYTFVAAAAMVLLVSFIGLDVLALQQPQ